MRWMSGLAMVAALAACAGEPQWSKDGVSGQAAAADYAECQGLAQEATQRDNNIEADILASRGHDWQQSGTLSTHQAVFSAENQHTSDQVVKSCMIGKGYAPRG
jgi:hypothetical protein